MMHHTLFVLTLQIRLHVQCRWLRYSCRIEGAGFCSLQAATGEDCRDDGEIVLEFVEVIGRGGGCVVERVEEVGVVGTEGQLGDYVREVEICGGVSMAVTWAGEGCTGNRSRRREKGEYWMETGETYWHDPNVAEHQTPYNHALVL